jgi:hypothetical protein
MLQSKARFGFIVLIVLAMLTRFLPHAPNFTAVGAAAIFGGFAFTKGWRAFVVPVLAVFLSDLVLNNVVYAAYYEGFQWLTPGFGYIYGAFILSVLLGRLQRKSFNAGGLVLTGVVSAILFFLLTNFGAWLSSPMLYPKNFGGLLLAYEAGLPFFLNQLAGNLIYGGILFTAAYYLFGFYQLKKLKA